MSGALRLQDDFELGPPASCTAPTYTATTPLEQGLEQTYRWFLQQEPRCALDHPPKIACAKN